MTWRFEPPEDSAVAGSCVRTQTGCGHDEKVKSIRSRWWADALLVGGPSAASLLLLAARALAQMVPAMKRQAQAMGGHRQFKLTATRACWLAVEPQLVPVQVATRQPAGQIGATVGGASSGVPTGGDDSIGGQSVAAGGQADTGGSSFSAGGKTGGTSTVGGSSPAGGAAPTGGKSNAGGGTATGGNRAP